MNTGSRDERQMLNDLARIARALERIANVAEEQAYGVTGPQLEALKRQMLEDAESMGYHKP